MKLVGALVSGEIIIFMGGCAWLALQTRVGWSNSFRIGALPFLPGEVIKMALIVAAVGGLNLARPKNSN